MDDIVEGLPSPTSSGSPSSQAYAAAVSPPVLSDFEQVGSYVASGLGGGGSVGSHTITAEELKERQESANTRQANIARYSREIADILGLKVSEVNTFVDDTKASVYEMRNLNIEFQNDMSLWALRGEERLSQCCLLYTSPSPRD